MKISNAKKINCKKVTIAKIDLKNIQGGHVNPTAVTDTPGCFPETANLVCNKASLDTQ